MSGSAPSAPNGASAASNRADAWLDTLLARYAEAAQAKDAAALMRLYDASVRVFDLWERWSYESASAWQAAVEGWFGSLGAEGMRVTFDDVATMSSGDLALVTAIVSYTALSAEGEPLRSMQNRLSWGVNVSGDDATIVHEHTSAPVGMQDLRAILRRERAG